MKITDSPVSNPAADDSLSLEDESGGYRANWSGIVNAQPYPVP